MVIQIIQLLNVREFIGRIVKRHCEASYILNNRLNRNEEKANLSTCRMGHFVR